jgi:energy-coupling factor transport system ATP-binding protein
MLDALNIVHLRHRKTETLSGGELQRVAIAGILTMHPQILLLDEPTSQLDPQSAEDMLRTVNDLRADLGITVVVAEHRLERLISHADRVLDMFPDGRAAIVANRAAIASLPGAPAVSAIGAKLGWSPLPLSIVEARRFVGRRPASAPAAAESAAAGATLVDVDRVEVTIERVAVLRGISLALRRGEVCALMGRNGAGKTTLLRAIAGLVAPSAGDVRSEPPTEGGDAPYRRIAYVAQDPSSMLYKDSAEDEIADVLRGTGRDGSVSEALDEWRLHGIETRHPRDLSVGERQRLALAAMLVGTPDLILLDEPTRGMDAGTKDLLVANLRRRAAAGAAIVIASHDVELAARCSDRVVLLSDGEIVEDGLTRRVLTDSLIFTTQANKLVGGDVLTADDAVRQLTKVPS